MPVAVIGMGRSGTSLVSRLLSLCGLYLGEDADMMRPHEVNPKGFWEHLGIFSINCRILDILGGDWRYPPTPPANWVDLPEIAALRDEAHELIARAFGDKPLWGWKEPRTTFTLPFWRQVVPDLGFVVCVRNPLDAARSVTRFDHTPLSSAVALWHYYTDLALRQTQPDERVLVHYEHFFDDYRKTLAPLLEFAGLPALRAGSLKDEAVADFIDGGLKHQHTCHTALMDDPTVPTYTKNLYAALVHQPASLPGLTALPESACHLAEIRALIRPDPALQMEDSGIPA